MPVFEMSLAEMKHYRGCSPLPHDFDAYWKKAQADLDKTGLAYTLEPAEFKSPGVLCYHLWFMGVRGARIHCKLLRPEKIVGKAPGVAVFHGYMHNSGEWTERLPYVYAGYVVLVMDARGQGGLSEDVYHGIGPTIFGHVVRGVRDADAQNLYFRDVYLDAAKTVRILMHMDFVDETRIAVTGKSQGGGLSLAAAALVPEVKRAAPIFPFLCDFKRVAQLDLNINAYEGLYYFFKKCDPHHDTEDAVYERLGYIDIQNFTPRIKAEVLWQTGLMDRTCPPSTQFAAYNKLHAPKKILLYPDYDHEQLLCAADDAFAFVTQ